MNNTMDISSFIDSVKVKKGETASHTTMFSPRCSFYVPNDKSNDFWNYYCDAISKNRKLGITEKPLLPESGSYGISPLRGDIDLKRELEFGLDRTYNDNHVNVIIDIYQNIIRDVVPSSAFNEKMLYCVVLEKKSPRVEAGIVKDGWHWHFPFFHTDSWMQDVYMRDIAIKHITERKLFDNMNLKENVHSTGSADVNNILDPIATKTWLLYKSSKSYDGEAYHMTRIVNGNMENVPLSQLIPNGGESDVRSTAFGDMVLPRLLSIRENIKATPLVDKISSIRDIKPERKRRSKTVNKTRSMEDSLADLKTLEDGGILDMLNINRSDNYANWMDVGWTLYSVGQGCEKALNMWKEFSKSSSKYDEVKCDDIWDTMEIRDKTIASILAMAKSDSPNEYKEWKNTNIMYCLYEAVATAKPTHYGIAKVLHRMYEDRFVCAHSKKDLWYEFINHRWRFIDDGINIKRLIPVEVANKFREFISQLANQARGVEPGAQQDKLDMSIKRAWFIIQELQQGPFMDRVVKTCKMLFYNSKFLFVKDENRDLVAFENGVYDLKLSLFRDGRLDDYITMSCGLNYKEFSWEDEDVKNVSEYLEKVFPNINLRGYFQDVMCSCLQGGNIHKNFVIFTGEGDNSKSIIVSLLEEVFGEYIFKFPRGLFVMGSGAQNSTGPKPELTRVRGKRIAFAQEIAKNEKIHIGFLKEATGNDSFFARSLYEEGGDIKPMFTLFLMCNDPPDIPGHDHATWNRVRKLDFESRFVDNPPESIEEQIKLKKFKKDPNFKEQLSSMAQPLMWILLQRYKKYKINGMNVPKEVLLSTMSYQEANDIYLQYVKSRIIKTDNENDYIKLTDMYNDFKIWFNENYPTYSKDRISKQTMRSEMCKRLGGMGKQSRWRKCKLIIGDEDLD